MACGKFNMTKATCTQVEIGKNYRLGFTCEDGNDDPIPLTGRDITLVIKDKNDDTFSDITLTEVNDPTLSGLYYSDPTNGYLVIQILIDISSTLSKKTYVYEMYDNTEGITLMSGGIQVVEGEF